MNDPRPIVLILAEPQGFQPHPIAFELLYKGRELANQLDASLEAILCGPPGIQGQLLNQRGADRVHVMENDMFSLPDEMVFAQQMAPLIQQLAPEVVLVGATAFGRSLAPRLAAALKIGLTADCTNLFINEHQQLVQVRPAFSENILAQIISDTRPQMATIRYKEFPEASGGNGMERGK